MRWLFAVCFIANLLAVIVVMSVDGAKSSSGASQTAAKSPAKQISEAIKSLGTSLGNRLEKNFNKLIDVVNDTIHETPEPDATFASCRDIYLDHKSVGNKAYMLQMDTRKVPVYCHMTSTGLDACGGGGWTLAMKIDGTKSTFHYDSKFWTNKIDFNLPGGRTGFDTQETKLPTYWNTRFGKVCLGIRIGNQLNFVMINQHANSRSLHSMIADGVYRDTSLGRNTWKTLIGSQASLQLNCNMEGFNAHCGSPRARIGILGNSENDCNSCDSRIGLGTGGKHDDSNTCGNEAKFFTDNGDKHIKAMGYILVQ